MIPRYNVDHRDPSFSNIWELQPLLKKLSVSPKEMLDAMDCQICNMFSVNSRQCCVCLRLTCLHCSVGQSTPDDMEKDPLTGYVLPDTCMTCKKNNTLIVGMLGEPNVLAGKQ